MAGQSRVHRPAFEKKHALAWGESAYLRFPRASDRVEFLAAVRKSKRLHRPFMHPARTEAEYADYLKGAKRGIQRRTLVCRTDDGAIAGFLNFNVITYGGLRSAFLGYSAFEPYAAQGYLREGLSLGLHYGFGALGLHRLEANIQTSNKRSVRLVSRAGFHLEGFSPRYLKIGGRWKDHLRFALLKEDWKDRKKAVR